MCSHRRNILAITSIALPGATARQLEPKQVCQIKAGRFDLFQFDATAYLGNSGSPLIDVVSGEVVGAISIVLIKAAKEATFSLPYRITCAILPNFLFKIKGVGTTDELVMCILEKIE